MLWMVRDCFLYPQIRCSGDLQTDYTVWLLFSVDIIPQYSFIQSIPAGIGWKQVKAGVASWHRKINVTQSPFTIDRTPDVCLWTFTIDLDLFGWWAETWKEPTRIQGVNANLTRKDPVLATAPLCRLSLVPSKYISEVFYSNFMLFCFVGFKLVFSIFFFLKEICGTNICW